MILCAAAILQARIKRVVCGALDPKQAAVVCGSEHPGAGAHYEPFRVPVAATKATSSARAAINAWPEELKCRSLARPALRTGPHRQRHRRADRDQRARIRQPPRRSMRVAEQAAAQVGSLPEDLPLTQVT